MIRKCYMFLFIGQEHTRMQFSVIWTASREEDEGADEEEASGRAEAEEELRIIWFCRIRAVKYGARRRISDLDIDRKMLLLFQIAFQFTWWFSEIAFLLQNSSWVCFLSTLLRFTVMHRWDSSISLNEISNGWISYPSHPSLACFLNISMMN